jgi:hypothetical protein
MAGRPWTDWTPIIKANLHKDQFFTVNAEPDGKPGHYTATLTFPKEGEWRWFIEAFSMNQFMPMLTVAPAVSRNCDGERAGSEFVHARAVDRPHAGVGTRRGRFVLCISATKSAGVWGDRALPVGWSRFLRNRSRLPRQRGGAGDAPVQIAADESISQVELGRQLFVAKGCITCHVNRKIRDTSQYWTIDMGAPDLTKFSASPEVLFIRLKDPRRGEVGYEDAEPGD